MTNLFILLLGIVIGAVLGYPIGAWVARKKAQLLLVRSMWR